MLAEHGAALLGATLDGSQPLSGGDLSELVLIRLADGRQAVVKGGPAPRVEAAMLEAIASTGAPAPRVLALDDRVLVMEALASGGRLAQAGASLGAAVRMLHDATGARYGWAVDAAFGPVAIKNRWCDDWPTFFAERRLGVHLPFVSRDLGRRIEALVRDLANRLPKHPKASLLHGDLWSGNVLVAGDRVSGLIDPACYHGDGEVDLAMLHLFGAPGPAFAEAYGPLPEGHAARRPIYTLWPALVHLRLFGDGYRGLVERQLGAAGV